MVAVVCPKETWLVTDKRHSPERKLERSHWNCRLGLQMHKNARYLGFLALALQVRKMRNYNIRLGERSTYCSYEFAAVVTVFQVHHLDGGDYFHFKNSDTYSAKIFQSVHTATMLFLGRDPDSDNSFVPFSVSSLSALRFPSSICRNCATDSDLQTDGKAVGGWNCTTSDYSP